MLREFAEKAYNCQACQKLAKPIHFMDCEFEIGWDTLDVKQTDHWLCFDCFMKVNNRCEENLKRNAEMIR